MTNEYATKLLKRIQYGTTYPVYKALDMAIEALTHFNSTSNSIKNELNELSCSESPNMSDTIYRQDAIDALINDVPVYGMLDDDGHIRTGCMDKDVIAMLAELPSAQPERKKGEWIPERLECTNGGTYQVYRCDQCHEAFNWKMDFCGGCGAEMKGEEHETD